MQAPAPPGPLGKLFALVGGAVLLVLGFMFSLALLAVVAVLGLAGWAWFWWKTRELRRVLRQRGSQGMGAPGGRPDGGPDSGPAGEVIEGEAVVVEEWRETKVLPGRGEGG